MQVGQRILSLLRRKGDQPPMGRMRAALFAILAIAPSTALADIQGRVIRVGLFEGGGGQLVREGEWSFVEVDLKYNGNKPFDGELRVEQQDRDGDVATSVTPIALAPTGEPRPYSVYFSPQDIGQGGQVHIRVYDNEGALAHIRDDAGMEVDELISSPVTILDGETLLVVDLSVPRKLPQAAWLDSRRARMSPNLLNQRVVRAMTPGELPSHWHGLAAVDALIWDDADPSLASAQQIDALAEWVRHGGRLLISSGSNWQSLAHSSLSQILPVTITDIKQAAEAINFEEIVSPTLSETLNLPRQYAEHPITRCMMNPLPGAMRIPRETAVEPIAFRALVGRGMVCFVGASLRQLLPAPKKLDRIDDSEDPITESPSDLPYVRACEQVVAQNLLLLPAQREAGDSGVLHFDPADLFQVVRQSIGFESLGAAFLIFAVLFALGYAIIAAIGSYFYLRRRSMLHHCWTAFAVISIAGSIVGTGMVWVLRGFSTKLWQTTVIDAHAGRDYGYGTAMFGVRTKDHTRLHLALPMGTGSGASADLGNLRGMPESTSLSDSRSEFVAPESYRQLRYGTELEGVPLRATLKEFIGDWHGPLGGTIDARLQFRTFRDEENDRHQDVTDASFIRNRLGTALEDCFLIETEDEGNKRDTASSSNVRCYFLGTLAPDGDGAEWNAGQLREKMFLAPPDPLRPDDPRKFKPGTALLIGPWINRWRSDLLSKFSAVTQFGQSSSDLPQQRLSPQEHEYALLLLSTYDMLHPGASSTGSRELHRAQGRPIGCMQQLTANSAILIGYSIDPPPTTLEVDRASLRPVRSHTMYRIVIPVERK